MTFQEQMTIGLSIVTSDGTTNLNDGTIYKIAKDGTREQVSRTFNQTKATSPALAGEYLVHSVPGMVQESVTIWAFGTTQAELNTRYRALIDAFEHWQYQLVWTYTGYTETWNCNAVISNSADFGQGMIHNFMSKVTLQVPRFPTVTTS